MQAPDIQIQATYGNDQPLVSIIESNLDFERVVVRRNQYAIKALTPLDLLVEVTTVYLLEKFLLSPLIDPIAEKFNWKKAVSRHLKPFEPFSLIIHVHEEKFDIEASLGTSHHITAEIWELIHKTLDILKREQRLSAISKIRFVVEDSGELLILCYERNKPARKIDINKGLSVEIPEGRVLDEEKAISPEEFERHITEIADSYQQYVDDLKHQNGKPTE